MRDKNNLPNLRQVISSGYRSSRSYGMFKEAVNYAYFHPGTQIFVVCANIALLNRMVEYAPEPLKAYSIGYSIVDLHPSRKHIELDNGSRIIIGLIEGVAGREEKIE